MASRLLRASLLTAVSVRAEITADDDASLLQISVAKSNAQTRCNELMPRKPSDFPSWSCDGAYKTLMQSDFNDGTYIIDAPGKYILGEDIVFAPNTPGMFPAMDSEKYPPAGGYWLGFFAAISVAANDTYIDLNGYTIKMSEEFSLRQRFFSMIELAARPFQAATGPPQFTKITDALTPIHNVIVHGGILGLSSHMGVHGNLNKDIWLDNLQIRDFETGGIQLNGAERVHVTFGDIGPSLGMNPSLDPSDLMGKSVPALSTLSQAMNILRVVQAMPVSMQNEPVFDLLNQAFEDFVTARTSGESVSGTPSEVFADPNFGYDGRPEGSAIYGILFHHAGLPIHEFESCAPDEDATGNYLRHFTVSDTTIHDLALRVDEVVRMVVNGKPVMGPAGDQFQIWRVMDADERYVPNVLSDAQLRIAELKLDFIAKTGLAASDPVVFKMFGATNIPQQVIDWARNGQTMTELQATLTNDGAPFAFKCQGDSMNHFNKGVVGARFEFVEDVKVHNLNINNLENTGVRSEFAEHCDNGANYQGADVRGIFTANFGVAEASGVTIQHLTTSAIGTAHALDQGTESQQFPVGAITTSHALTQMRDD